MKIALIVPGGVDRTGTERVIPCLLWLIERLAKAADLHVFALRQEARPSTYPLLGATVHNIGARPRRARALAAIAGEHRRSRFDVLHAVWAAPPGVIAAAAGAALRRPVVLGITGGDLAALPDIHFGARETWRGRAWVSVAVAGATRVTVPSRAMLESARLLGIPAELIPLGVALDRWPVLAVRARVVDAPARLLHVASLNRVKDQRTLLLAMQRLGAAGVDFHLDIAGVDTLGGEVQTLATQLGLTEYVTFHGQLTQLALRPLVERADMLVMSSRHEADPIVALEAAVAGIPTVGTAVGHIRDWHGEGSVAVPVRDDVALAGAISALITDEPRRQRLASTAQSYAVSMDADWTAATLLGIYGELMRG